MGEMMQKKPNAIRNCFILHQDDAPLHTSKEALATETM